MPDNGTFRIAAVQAAPVFLDRDATIAKACALIEDAARQGAKLVAFPESFVPAYPIWAWRVPAGETHALRALYATFHANSVTIPSPAVSRLCEAAADCGVTVAIGVSERNAEASDSTLYNSLLYLGADGSILAKHRKLVPTAGERLVWGHAPDCDLRVLELPFARVAGLVCWENYMPLARYALTAWGEQIHIAPTWDRGEPWTSSMRHIAKEGRCFVMGVCQAFHLDHLPESFDFKRDYADVTAGWINPGLSVIADPDGKIVAGPLDSEEGILYAEVQPHQLVGPRWQLDVAGHYARPDVFELRVHREARPLVIEDGHRDRREESQ